MMTWRDESASPKTPQKLETPKGSETEESLWQKVATFVYKKGTIQSKDSIFESEAMNHGGGWSSGGRGGHRGRSQGTWQRVNLQKSESPVRVDRSLDESWGNRGRGSRGGGRCTQSRSRRNNNSPAQVYVEKKPSQVSNEGLVEKTAQQQVKSQEDAIGSTEQPDEGSAFKCSRDNKDVLQQSVSLSGQVSLSSTSDRKVELFSVEDRDSSHKSGDVANTLNESNTGPFDLCLEKKVMVLKPSLFVMNKGKRSATEGYTGVIIRPGMVHLQNYLSIKDQVMIVKKCRELGLGKGGFYQPGYRDGALLHLKMMCLGKNWDPQTSRYGDTRPHDGSIPPKIPFEFNQLVQKAIKDSQSRVATSSKKTKGEDEIPSMSPDICIANFYTSTGRLGLHQDKDESAKSIQKGLPVVSFSIGDSAEFVYGDQRNDDKAETVVLKSGDVLLFGGKSRNVFHGVKSILKDTAPKVLAQETSFRPGRLNLTFRQY